jgi:hypothetical protein
VKKTHLEKVLAMIIATTALGARGIACGPCNDSTSVLPVLPPSSDGGVEDGGDWLEAECRRKCINAISCEPMTIPLEDGGTAAAIECVQAGECGAGRRPFGFEEEPASEWLSRAAVLEAASVRAFRDLRRDLATLGAPRGLRRAASRAARDEQRHARRMRALARRRGARVAEKRFSPGQPISIEELATHNAVEGCVRESFGALVARWQGQFATDVEVRGAMARIARDEARHAALAFEVDKWLSRRLDPVTRARVTKARLEAARALARGCVAETADPTARSLGLPDAASLQALAKHLTRELGLA